MDRAQTNTQRIVVFLDENDDRPWTAEAIADKLGLETDTVDTILSELEDRDLVRNEAPHWAITDNEERLQAAYRLHQYLRNADDRYGEEHLETLRTEDTEAIS